MKVATLPDFGDPSVLQIAEVDVPVAGPLDVLIKVHAAGINRADILQRRGLYPAPKDAPAWPGLEVSGVIEAVGEDVDSWSIGDRVCALLPGGGYAEYVACHSDLVLPWPEDLSAVEAAALPEATCTVWSNFRVGGVVAAGEEGSILIHGGSGGIGTTAIQIAKAIGLTVAITAGGEERVRRCVDLGADIGINYRSTDFSAAVAKFGGVDMVLDCVGGEYLKRNLACLKDGGHLVIIGLQAGATAELNLATLLSRRLTVSGTSLRTRPIEQRAEIIRDVREHVWPLIPGQVRPVIHDTFTLDEVSAAHTVMDERGAFGKIVLTV